MGDVQKGVVKNITQFGAFINLDDNIDGLLHVSDMSWTKTIRHPKDFLSIGDEVEVKILEVSSEDKKISLGVKQLHDNPWDTLSDEFESGKTIKGKAIKIIDKGVIFELDHDVEGLLKTSDKDSFKIEGEYDLVVQGVDSETKKIIIMDDGAHSASGDAEPQEDSKEEETAVEETPEEAAAEEAPAEEEASAEEEAPAEEETPAEEASDDSADEESSDEDAEEKE